MRVDSPAQRGTRFDSMAETNNGDQEESFNEVNEEQPDADPEFDSEILNESGDGDTNVAAQDESGVEDPELEAIKARVREMEEEAEKLKEMQSEVEKQMNMSSPTLTTQQSIEDKVEADARSVYVGNVDYGATAEELEQHFHGCGSINRVTILCDRYTGHPKGFAYVEFADKDSVTTSLALDESLFRGRQIKVSAKRTNRPGISSTNRPPRGRFRARGARSYYHGYQPRPRGRFRRRAAWYSPY
ncbi:polyadenylate-binding protein 2-like [Liolophura sinensis]|uniref:polyadenylate-binding protein 2-like n=1 Tax=Liolophura sinensis TaxID=3198878 RepID=UPI003158EED0